MPTAAPLTKPFDVDSAPDAAASTGALARRASSASLATMASRILGVVREIVLATLFGPSNAMDAYRIAFRIPNMLRDLFAEGVMSAAFVPTFTRRLTLEGKPSALRLGVIATNALVVITGTLVIAGMIFAEPLVRLFVTSDYAAIPQQIDLTVFLSRIMMPYLTFIAVAATAMGMLNALHHFFLPALSPAMFNVVSIVSMVTLVPVMPMLGLPEVTAIAIGTVVGGFAQWAMQLPLLRREGLRYRGTLDWQDEGLRRMLILMGPGTIGLAATQINLLVSSYLASSETGVVSTLEWAFRVMYLPIGLFGVSIAAATLPAVSRQHAAQNVSAVRATIADGLSLMLMLNIPATVGLLVLATPIVRVMYEHGRFTAQDTIATAAALQLYAVGLVGYSIVRIVSPVFYAIGANRTPVIVGVVTVLLNALLSVTLVRGTSLEYRGLPLATSLSALFNCVVLMVLLRRRLHGVDGGRLMSSIVRIALASLAMGVTAFAVDRALAGVLPDGRLMSEIVRLALTIGCAMAVLATAAFLLRIREFRVAVAAITRRGSPRD
jgi:putative peptidoglycan lipid II flippase